jgi:transposase
VLLRLLYLTLTSVFAALRLLPMSDTDKDIEILTLRDRPAQSLEHRMTARALRSTAQRIHTLRAEAKALEDDITTLVRQITPELLELLGVGAISAAQVLVSWSHSGRFRSEAAFASFAGTAPIPASSGMTDGHRLDQGGDRQLNRALHTIVLVRTRVDPETKAYITCRVREGKSVREARRCLKRAIARRLCKILERNAKPPTATGPPPASTAA